MTNLIAIDPGYAAKSGGCACAWFEGDNLLRATWFMRPEHFWGSQAAKQPPLFGSDEWFGAIVWERPVHRVRDEQYSHAVPVETLLELTSVGSGLAHLYAGALGAEIKELRPHEWKHSRHKPPHHKALWRILTEAERAILGGDATYAVIEAACRKGALARWKPGVSYYPSTFITHNLLDAVALGCTYLKRMIP
jgi:hypothetical protein